MWKWLARINDKFDEWVSSRVSSGVKFFKNSYPKWDALNKLEQDKIRKLVNMFERCTSHERNVAYNKLRSLLDKHGMRINDVPNEKDRS